MATSAERCRVAPCKPFLNIEFRAIYLNIGVCSVKYTRVNFRIGLEPTIPDDEFLDSSNTECVNELIISFSRTSRAKVWGYSNQKIASASCDGRYSDLDDLVVKFSSIFGIDEDVMGHVLTFASESREAICLDYESDGGLISDKWDCPSRCLDIKTKLAEVPGRKVLLVFKSVENRAIGSGEFIDREECYFIYFYQ